jgi:hypothetical protein
MGFLDYRENITIGEIVAELKLEARMRRAVYGKKVRAGEMGEAEMRRKVALIEAAIELLRAKNQLSLFPEE